jgi:hypothetical protein
MRILLLACLLMPVAAQQPGQAVASKLGSLEGRVVNAKTSEPLRRVNLTLRPFGAPGVVGSVGSFSMGPMPQAAPYAATTDAEGKFRIDKVEPGQYRLMAERQGFVRTEYGARQNSMMGTTIRVSAGQELKETNINLTPQAVITGRVFDEEGEPLARVQVQVLRRRYFQGRQQMMPMGGGQTIDTGEFRIAELPPGRYWINALFRSRGGMFGEAAARNTADKPQEEYVTTYYPGTPEQTAARLVEVVAGQELPGIDIRMQKARVFRIRGKIVGGSQPVTGLRVMILPRQSGGFAGFMGSGGGIVKEDGSFEIGGVHAGSYYVNAMPMQGRMNSLGKVAVDVTRDNVENVSLVLAPGATLNGSIRIDGDVAALEKAQGKKITFSGVRIQLMPMDGMPVSVPSVLAKEDGSFTLENAGPEKYRVLAMGLPQGTYLKSIRAGDRDALDGGVDLSAGAPGPVQITLGLGPGSVTGTVQGPNQKPASGSMVTLLPDPIKEERGDLLRVATTDQNGQFTLQGLAPGEYKLFAWEDIEPGSYMDPEFLKPHEGQGIKVSVKENSQQSVSLTQIAAAAQ